MYELCKITMDQTIKISIIVPVYNAERFLSKCVSSILDSTYKNFELILVDDGSTDNSPGICDQFAKKDNRIIVVHQLNAGVSEARNKGLSLASGDFISFIDSDDFIHPQMIECLYNEIHNSNCSFSMVIEENVTEENYIIEKTLITNYTTENLNKHDCIFNLTHEGKEKRNFVHLLGKLYRKSLLSGMIFDKEISLSEDFLFNMEFYLKDGNGIRIMEPMYYRTLLRTDSLSARKPTDIIYNAGIYLKALSFIPMDKTKFRAYVLVNIMNRIIIFKKRNKKTSLYTLAKSKGLDLYSCIKKELLRNKDIPFKKKVKLLLKYYLY